MCLLAYAGVAGSAGFASAYGAWLLPATAAMLALAVGALAFARTGTGPVMVALAGAGATLAGRFRLDHPLVLYAGLAALVAATGWSARRRRHAPGHVCGPGCAGR